MPRAIRHTYDATDHVLESTVSSYASRSGARMKSVRLAMRAIPGTAYLVRATGQGARPFKVIRRVQIYRAPNPVTGYAIIVDHRVSALTATMALSALRYVTGTNSDTYRAILAGEIIPGTSGYFTYRVIQQEGTRAVPNIPDDWDRTPPEPETGYYLDSNDTMRATVYAVPSWVTLTAEQIRMTHRPMSQWEYCGRCATSVLPENMHTVRPWTGTDQRVCQRCYSRYVECVFCERAVFGYDVARTPDNNDPSCPPCYSARYVLCDHCGNHYSNDWDECGCDESRDARGCTCSVCLDEREEMPDSPGYINNYSYKPNTVFHGEGKLFFGMEIEVTTPYSAVRERAADVQNAFGDLVYLKEDGSISRGFEIVTHPMSYAWAMENVPWDRWGFLEHQGVGADDSTGIHIHVSRAGFAGPAHTYRWLQFFYRSQRQVEKIARRRGSNYARFGNSQRQMHILAAKGEQARCGRCYDCRNGGSYCSERYGFERYSAINCQNRHTFEVRVFASTVKANEIQAALGLVSASVEYTRGINSSAILRDGAWDWNAFASWVAAREEYTPLNEEINRLCAS